MHRRIVSGRKGISAVIATILLLLIVVAVIGMSFSFFQRTYTSSAGATEHQTEATASALAAGLKVENYDANSNALTLRNIGRRTLENFTVYVDGTQAPASSETMAPGSTGDLFLLSSLSAGEHTVRVVSAGTESALKISVPAIWQLELDASGF